MMFIGKLHFFTNLHQESQTLNIGGILDVNFFVDFESPLVTSHSSETAGDHQLPFQLKNKAFDFDSLLLWVESEKLFRRNDKPSHRGHF